MADIRFAALLRAKSQFISQRMTFSQDIDRAANSYMATQWKWGELLGCDEVRAALNFLETQKA